MTDIIHTEAIPQGYHHTNAGVLPNEWESRPLSSVVEEIAETAGARKIETVSISAGIGFVNQAEKFGKELSGKQYEKYTVLHQGDFSYNKGNSNLYPQGCIYRLNDREEAAVPNVFESFRVSDGNPDYYEQLFVSGFLNKQLYSKINHGVRDDGLLNLRGKDFYSCEVPCPPIDEQEKIAEILVHCDKMISLCQSKIDELSKQKKYFLKEMFPQQGSNVPNIRFPGFTAPWERRKLGDITSKIGSGKTPRGGASTYKEYGITLIRSQNVNDDQVDLSDVVYIDETTDEEMKGSRVLKGDVLLNITGASLGRSAVFTEDIRANVNQHVCIIRPQSNAILSEFVQLNIISDLGQKQIDSFQAGGGREGLNFQQISKMEFWFPSKSEQEKIGAFFGCLDNVIVLHKNELSEMKRHKKALMQLLLTGIVRTNDGK